VTKKVLKAKQSRIEQSLDYEDLALFEIVQDEIFFQEFFLPRPGTQELLREYQWTPESGRVVWYFQYPFVLTPKVVGECGRAVGKTTIGMQGGTLYDMVNLNNMQSAVAGPTDQHTLRVFNEVLAILEDHRYLSDWLTKDSRRTGAVRRQQRQVRTRNGWELHGLIPGIAGLGFRGEHPTRLRIDEAQSIPTEGMKYLDDAIRPFKPIERKSREQFFGVPDGNRMTRYYEMCHDDTQEWRPWILRVPSFLAPTMPPEDFKSLLRRTGCLFLENEDRVIVTNWSNDAKQNTLGQWGDPAFPCFPQHIYEAATVPGGTPSYHVIDFTSALLRESIDEPDTLIRQLLLQGPSRDKFGEVHKVLVGIDTGRELCPVTIWVKPARSSLNHPAKFWLVERIDIRRVMDTPMQARIVDAILDYWQADWVCIDSTSMAVYLADFLCDEALFGYKGRLKLVDTSRGVLTNSRDPVQIAEARGWKGQVVVPVDFSGKLPIRYELNEPVLADANVFPVSLLQDLMQVGEPQLLLPTPEQDASFFGQMTSYREVISAAGRRYQPVNPHYVDAVKTFAVGVLYSEFLNVDTIETELPEVSGGVISSGSVF
jgi:hypothetical protein